MVIITKQKCDLLLVFPHKCPIWCL
uniref:Uncharacterized protein n=1 Tax=Rhizophora mucronata TaxID=61149 RepID=A0A2P2IU80_RHIMU